MGKLLLRIILVLVGLAAAVVVLGMLLPRGYSVTAEIEIQGSAADIYPRIAGLKRWQSWSPWGDHIEGLELEYAGPESGEGASMIWRDPRPDNRFDGQLTIVSADQPKAIEYQSSIGDIPMDGGFEIEEIQPGLCRVRWSASGKLPGGAAYGYFGLTYNSFLQYQLDQSLQKLKQQVEGTGSEGGS